MLVGGFRLLCRDQELIESTYTARKVDAWAGVDIGNRSRIPMIVLVKLRERISPDQLFWSFFI